MKGAAQLLLAAVGGGEGSQDKWRDQKGERNSEGLNGESETGQIAGGTQRQRDDGDGIRKREGQRQKM